MYGLSEQHGGVNMGQLLAGILCFAFAAVFLILCILSACENHGFRKQLTDITIGQLIHTEIERNVHIKKAEKNTHKWICATYMYKVYDNSYTKKCIVIDRYKPMPCSTKVIYQKRKPQYAYLPEFETYKETDYTMPLIFAGAFIILGVIMLF